MKRKNIHFYETLHKLSTTIKIPSSTFLCLWSLMIKYFYIFLLDVVLRKSSFHSSFPMIKYKTTFQQNISICVHLRSTMNSMWRKHTQWKENQISFSLFFVPDKFLFSQCTTKRKHCLVYKKAVHKIVLLLVC